MLKFIFLFIPAFFIFSTSSFADEIPATLNHFPTGTCKPYQNLGDFSYNVTFEACFSEKSALAAQRGRNVVPVYPTLESDGTYSNGGGYYYNDGLKFTAFSFTTTNVVSSYSCDDPAYPEMSQDGKSCLNSFGGASSELDQFIENKADLEIAFDALDTNVIDPNLEAMSNINNSIDEQLDATAQAMANVDNITQINDNVKTLSDLSPDNSSLQSLSNIANSIDIESQALLSDSFENVTGMINQRSDATAIFNSSNQFAGFAQDGIEYYYGLGEQLYTATSQSQVDSISDSMAQAMSEINSNIEQSYTTSSEINNSINIINSLATENNNNIAQISNNNQTALNINSESSNASSNGETCIAGECVSTPAPEESNENSTVRIKTPTVTEGFYTSLYPDGFDGLLNSSIDGFKSGPFYEGMQQFSISIGGGSVPSWNLCFDVGIANLGCHDLSVPAYVWDFIKACLLICSAFLCRAIIFGG